MREKVIWEIASRRSFTVLPTVLESVQHSVDVTITTEVWVKFGVRQNTCEGIR